MNAQQAIARLPPFLVPFFTFSYPTAPPAVPDSFPNSSYYNTGPLDACIIISCIAVMSVLRDVARLYLLEPFARWKLTRDIRLQRNAKTTITNGKTNGVTNGHTATSDSANGETKENGEAKATGVEYGNGHAVLSATNKHANGNEHIIYAQGIALSRKEAKRIHRSVLRFAEQGWSVISYTFVWCFGLYVHSQLPTRVLDPIDAWLNYPHIPLAGPVKFYYLLETALYCHQILIINAEARRKDHWQMMTHHVITIALMVGSYSCFYTRVGCLVMLIMDWCDIWLPLAKMLRYLSLTTACDIAFVLFMVSWAITRHVLFILVIKSTWDAQYLIPHLWDPVRGQPMSAKLYWSLLAMIIALQVIQMMWFWRICRVAYRVVSGKGAEDERSDDEDDDSYEGEGEEKRGR